MKPSTAEIIDSIIWSLQTYVTPEIQSPFAESVLKTVENLLRHVKLRESSEIPLLLEDVHDLESLLKTLHAELGSHRRLSGALATELANLNQGLGETGQYPLTVPLAGELNARSESLRHILDELLKSLSNIRADYADDETYRKMRESIRAYIARSLQREGQLVTPAFTGGRR